LSSSLRTELFASSRDVDTTKSLICRRKDLYHLSRARSFCKSPLLFLRWPWALDVGRCGSVFCTSSQTVQPFNSVRTNYVSRLFHSLPGKLTSAPGLCTAGTQRVQRTRARCTVRQKLRTVLKFALTISTCSCWPSTSNAHSAARTDEFLVLSCHVLRSGLVRRFVMRKNLSDARANEVDSLSTITPLTRSRCILCASRAGLGPRRIPFHIAVFPFSHAFQESQNRRCVPWSYRRLPLPLIVNW